MREPVTIQLDYTGGFNFITKETLKETLLAYRSHTRYIVPNSEFIRLGCKIIDGESPEYSWYFFDFEVSEVNLKPIESRAYEPITPLLDAGYRPVKDPSYILSGADFLIYLDSDDSSEYAVPVKGLIGFKMSDLREDGQFYTQNPNGWEV